MRRRDRWIRWLGLAALLAASPVIVLAGTVAATGTIQVAVQERDGVRLWIPVPAVLADVGIAAVDLFLDDDALADARREVGPWIPMLRELSRELERSPDATFVEVVTPGETVRVRKAGRNFEVDVDADDTDVSIRVPARLLGRTLTLLDGSPADAALDSERISV